MQDKKPSKLVPIATWLLADMCEPVLETLDTVLRESWKQADGLATPELHVPPSAMEAIRKECAKRCERCRQGGVRVVNQMPGEAVRVPPGCVHVVANRQVRH